MHTFGPSLPPPPRAVKLSGSGWAGRFVLGLVFPALLLIAAVASLNDLAEIQDLISKGQLVDATVLDKEVRHGKSTSYRVEYSVMGETRWATISHEDYDEAAIGQPIQVTVDPANPKISRVGPVTEATLTRERNTMFGFEAFFALIWLFGVILLERSISREREVLSNGIAVPAEITDVQRPGRNLHVRYAYERPDGTHIDASAVYSTSKHFFPGMTTTALYYEPDPRLSRLMDAISLVKLK